MQPFDVIIVTYRSVADVGRCIEAARACEQIGRLIVVDNASDDGSPAAAARAGADVVLGGAVNAGFARAVNRGLRETSTEYVLLLNPDAVVTETAVGLLLAALEANPVAVMAGPMLVTPSGRTLPGGRRFSTVVNRLLWHLPLPARPAWSTPEYGVPGEGRALGASGVVEVEYLWGACLLCRRAFLDDIGGLDERFFLYSEDEDLGRQARRAGRRSLLVTGAAVEHVGGASTSDDALAQARVELATALLLEKWHGPAAAAAFRAGIVLALAARAALLFPSGRRESARLALRTCVRLLRPWARGATPRASGPLRSPDWR